MRKLLSKFKLKWWSWEIDTFKLFPFAFLVLAFLPILPYETKDGKLISVMGYEAGEKNFYRLNLDKEIMDLTETDIPDFSKQKKYLLNRGYSEEKAKCINIRDLYLYDYFYNNQMQIYLNKWATSPVPIILLTKTLLKDILSRELISGSSYETFEKLKKECKKFGNIVPPPGYLENKFKYEKK